MILRAAAESHTGYVRANNQDTALISGDLLAVADGMGGHLGGEVAARTAIEELLQAYLRDRTGAGLESAVRRANQAIWRKSRADRKLHGMGTTLTAVALVEGEAAVARDAAGRGDSGGQRSHLALVNVGDSRAYSIDPDTREMKRLTEDHSVVEEMVRQGELTPDEAAVHPHRHVLTRALGIDSEVDLDIWDLEPALGSRILLCSDGLTNEVTENEIAQVLAASPDPAEAARELVGRALGHGGMDNVTVVVIDVLEGEDVASQPVEMIPPPPGSPDLREQAGGADITQALPITRAGAEAAPSVSRETTDAIPATPEDPDATQALGSEDRPEPGAVGPAAAAAGAAAAAPAAAGVATEALGAATPADASAQQAGTPASSTSEQPSVASPPSAGAAAAAGAAGPRSMTMRGSAPS
ncbi:MAG: protein phosphatase 2C domain-containing protein, partial [Acidimicrobiales bacterium]